MGVRICVNSRWCGYCGVNHHTVWRMEEGDVRLLPANVWDTVSDMPEGREIDWSACASLPAELLALPVRVEDDEEGVRDSSLEEEMWDLA